ncbi:MAG: HupE/UreJ family protein [Thermodesulfobacteriota bacterium]
MLVVLLASTILASGSVPEARGHEARPAYLEIRETTPNRYHVLWRTPLLSGMRLPLALQLPAGVRDVTEPAERVLSDSVVERRVIEAPAPGLAGQRIAFLGLQSTITDVLVHVSLAGGASSTTLVHPSRPWVEIAAAGGAVAIAGAYFRHGLEHILLGYDHLLFVLALMLVVRSTRALLTTITAFTLAHSITLALAVLGAVRLPGPPVEATIALSIVLLAREIVHVQRGGTGATARSPWLVAFAFGLLHGFGFAGAMSEMGVPRDDVPLALLSFNVGVEIGQLAFIAAALGLATLARCAAATLAMRMGRVAPFGMGILAAFWFFERLASFW